MSDIDPGKRALAEELGATWSPPEEAIVAEVDVLIPAALGGILTEELVPKLRCRAVAGPANNQLAAPDVADLLHRREVVWVPDYVAGAGGGIYALTTELHHGTADDALTLVQAVEGTVSDLLRTAERLGVAPAQAALELTQARLRAD